MSNHNKDCSCYVCSLQRGMIKGSNHHSFTDGKCSKSSSTPVYCSDCQKKLHDLAYYKGTTKCFSCKRKGHKVSLETRRKLSKSVSKNTIFKPGKLNPNWKGGTTTLQVAIRGLFKYSEWKRSVFERDRGQCVKCGDWSKLEIDHIIPFARILEDFLKQYSQFSPYEDVETLVRLSETYASFWDVSNGQVLCSKCHMTKTLENRV